MFQKNQTIKYSFLFLTFFFIMTVFFGLSLNTIQATAPVGDILEPLENPPADTSIEVGRCFTVDKSSREDQEATFITRRSCQIACFARVKARPDGNLKCYWNKNADQTRFGALGTAGATSQNQSIATPNRNYKDPDICKINFLGGSLLRDIFVCILQLIMQVVALILYAGVGFMKFALNPERTYALLNHPIIYTLWTEIRNLVTMFFILLLLLSAFATIFQVQQYNFKKLFSKIILAALIVNFSFPITRFLIDLSNVVTYSLASFFDIGNSGAGNIMNSSGIIPLITSDQIPVLIFGIIAIFLLGISFMAAAFMLFVRTMVFMVLIIFSPIAFVSGAFSFGGMGSASKKWWSTLTQYSIFGPTMLLMFYLAMRIMIVLNDSYSQMSSSMGTGGSEVLASIVFCLIPVGLIWMGIMTAAKSGVVGAKATMGQVEKFAKWLPNASWRATGIPGTTKRFADDFKKTGKVFGKKIPLLGSQSREEREERWAGGLSGGLSGAQKVRFEQERKKVKEIAEKMDVEHMLTSDLLKKSKDTKDKFGQAAAMQELLERGKNENLANDIATIAKEFGPTSLVFRQFQSKAKYADPMAAFGMEEKSEERVREFVTSNQFDAKKLNANAIGNNDLMRMMFESKAIDSKKIMDIIKDSPHKKTNINNALRSLINNTSLNDFSSEERKEVSKAFHTAIFAQLGEIHEENIPDNEKADVFKHIFSGINKDNVKNMKSETAGRYASEIAKHIKSGKFNDIAEEMNNDALHTITTEILALNDAQLDSNQATIKHIVRSHTFFRNLRGERHQPGATDNGNGLEIMQEAQL